MKNGRLALIILAVLFAVNVLHGQTVPPALFVSQTDKDGKTVKQQIPLSDLNIEVKIHGFLSETKMTMTFKNTHSRALAGDLYFPLPQGSTVSGYALDINGSMVDGVIVEKAKGRQVFEKIVRQGIDPGLVEWVKGNNFKTRVFPIPANGTRTVMVKYVSDLVDSTSGLSYLLPLSFTVPVEHAKMRIEVVKSETEPVIQKGIKGLAFGKWKDSFVAEAEWESSELKESLEILIPEVKTKRVMVEKAPDGYYYFCLNDYPVIPEFKLRKALEDHVILWDVSGSRAYKSHDKELKLLKKYLNGIKGDVELKVVLFANTIIETRMFKSSQEDIDSLITFLSGVQYDGGTSGGCIAEALEGMKGIGLLFTDGISNFGEKDPGKLSIPLYVISDDPVSDYSYLTYLALRSGGSYFNLQQTDESIILKSIGAPKFKFRSAEAKEGVISGVYPSQPVDVQGRVTVVGRFESETASVAVAYNNSAVSAFTVTRETASEGNLLRRYWAQKKVDELAVFAKEYEDEIVATGKEFGIVTPGTSLIVLESLAQYIEHKIEPSVTLPKVREQYLAHMKKQTVEAAGKKASKIEYVLGLWKTRVTWWEKEFTYAKDFRYGGGKRKKGIVLGDSAAPAVAEGADDEAPVEETEALDTGLAGVDRAPGAPERARRAFGRGGGAAKKDQKQGSSAPAIVIKKYSPDTPYLKVLKSAKQGNLYSLYIGQRKDYASSPGFFLDCADFFREKQDVKTALRVLSNIAELELENAALVRILAHRLAQIGELDLAVLLFEEALRLRPEEPQSWRDLGLVLVMRADKGEGDETSIRRDYERALKLLNHVVMNTWDRFPEIEVITLMEINRTIPRARKAGVTDFSIDSRLEKLLDVEVRIILSWDADLTDMDLWVTEPSGEKAIYSHPRTTIGGHMSKDYTGGYGPEEYILKKAMNGMYKIEANYYGSSSASLIGPVTLQVDVFTNYGRENEQRKSITLRLKGSKDKIMVGEIEF